MKQNGSSCVRDTHVHFHNNIIVSYRVPVHHAPSKDEARYCNNVVITSTCARCMHNHSQPARANAIITTKADVYLSWRCHAYLIAVALEDNVKFTSTSSRSITCNPSLRIHSISPCSTQKLAYLHSIFLVFLCSYWCWSSLQSLATSTMYIGSTPTSLSQRDQGICMNIVLPASCCG